MGYAPCLIMHILCTLCKECIINIDGFVTGIFGGFLLGVRSGTGLAFYDWETLELVRRIDIQPRHVFWSESGELVCLATEESYFILKYDSSVVARAHETKEGLTEDGIEEAFNVSLLLFDDVEPSIVYCNKYNLAN